MGFNTWNWFGCRNSSGHGLVTDDMMRQVADAFISKGLAEVGYNYVCIDDCWATLSRNSSRGLVPDPRYWPKGIRAFTDYVHSKGLKAGIYSDIGSSTCATCYGGANPQGLPGMQGGFEQQDCDSFVAWGFDYLKLDFCCFNQPSASAAYAKVRDALKNAVTRMKPTVPDAHPIVYSICEWGSNSPWLWGDSVGNLWRTTNDIGMQWNSLMNIVDKNAPLYKYARLGSWNDPDMLEIGNGDFANNIARNRSHMSLWCIMSSALIAGNDIRTMSSQIQEILTNKDAIDINQDTLGGDTTLGIVQGRRVVSGNSEVWAKLLKGKENSDYAILLFNRNNSNATTISITTDQIKSVGGDIASGKAYKVRDVWGKKDLPDWTAGGTFTSPAPVGVNDVFMARLSLIPPIAVAPIATIHMTDKHVQSEGEHVVVNLKKAGSSTIRIVNLNGKVVYSKNLSGLQSHSISTRDFSRGLYIVNVQNASERFEEKIFLK
jgi:alpha-galactosidase